MANMIKMVYGNYLGTLKINKPDMNIDNTFETQKLEA